MRWYIIKQILKKELIDITRDKKTLFMMVILPILLYPLLMIGVTQIMTVAMSSMEQKTVQIAIKGEVNPLLAEALEAAKEGEGKVEIITTNDYEEDLAKGEIDAYLETTQEGQQEAYKIYMNASETDSSAAANRIEDALDTYKEQIVAENIQSAGLDKEKLLEPITYSQVNVAKNEEMAGSFLGQLLPFILVVGVMMGCIYPAIDVMAGEKERGTLETLLTLPISNLELIIGKYLAVSLSAVVTAILNMISILGTVGFMLGGQGLMGEGFEIQWGVMVLPLLIATISVCLFAMVIAAVSMCVCSLAKNFKDAQNYVTPLMLIVMLPSYVSMVPTIELTPVTASIPVVNISLLIKSVLSFKYDFGLMSIVMVSNLAFVVLAVVLLSKMFNSEEILFGDSKSFNLLEKRSNIEKGSLPGLSDGLTAYAIVLLGSIYIGTWAQIKWGLAGNLMTQAIIIGVPLLITYYIKGHFKQIFKLKLPRLTGILGGLCLWLGTFIVITLMNQITLRLFPQNQETMQALNDMLFGESSFLINLILVAVMPAVCEECLFRGFLLTAFSDKGKVVKGIILSSVLFGLMHIDFIRILPTALLGLCFAYIVYTTGSILVAMCMHFLNNGLAVWMMHYEHGKVASLMNTMEITKGNMNVYYWGVSAVVLVVVGVLILKKCRKSQKVQV
ncbi:MAG: ABC transporter permease subunit/CPBP intramembrane protease [Cellulosilyticaceae bacterium]